MKRDEWTTPPKLFKWLDDKCHFTIDAAASKKNALCKKYFTKKDNALEKILYSNERYFCNPPYSLDCEFVEHFLKRNLKCVLLLPVRSDRLWFQETIHTPYFQVCWLTGRIHFGGMGKGAFMYSVIIMSGFEKVELPDYIGAENFNANGRGGATY